MKRYFYEAGSFNGNHGFVVRDTLRGSEGHWENFGARVVATCNDRDDAEMIVELLNAVHEDDADGR